MIFTLQINAGNTSVVDIADVVQNKTDKGSSITGADLTCLVLVVKNMTTLLEMEVSIMMLFTFHRNIPKHSLSPTGLSLTCFPHS